MPIYSFKTVSNEVFEIDAELDETVGQLRSKVHALKGYEPSLQKLICAGKVIADDSLTIGAAGETKAKSLLRSRCVVMHRGSGRVRRL